MLDDLPRGDVRAQEKAVIIARNRSRHVPMTSIIFPVVARLDIITKVGGFAVVKVLNPSSLGQLSRTHTRTSFVGIGGLLAHFSKVLFSKFVSA